MYKDDNYAAPQNHAQAKALSTVRFHRIFLMIIGIWLVATVSSVASSVNGFDEAVKVLTNIVSEQFRPIKGTVVGVRGNDVYINLGINDRVRVGQLFEVVRPEGELKDPVTGEIMGSFESPIGVLQVQTVRESYSIGTMKESIGQPPQVGDYVFSKVEKSSIGVVPFAILSGSSVVLGQVFADRLSTMLAADPNLQVVEREQLNRALAELKFGQSGLVDVSSAQKLGAFLGVNALVVGTMAELGRTVSINMRVIDVKTGLVLAAHSIDVVGENLSGAQIERPLSTSSQFASETTSDLAVTQTQVSQGVALVPSGSGSVEFAITYRQQLKEFLDNIAVGDFQGRGRLDLAGSNESIDQGKGKRSLYVYRYTDHYERIWYTDYRDDTVGRTFQVVVPGKIDLPGKQEHLMKICLGNTIIWWDGTRWQRSTLRGYPAQLPVGDGKKENNFLTLGSIETAATPEGYIKLEVDVREHGTDKFLEGFSTDVRKNMPWTMPPVVGKPLPNGEYMLIISKPGEDRLLVLDRAGEIQWESQELACVVAGITVDIDNDGVDEIILAQLVDENGRPDMETKAKLIKGDVPDPNKIATELVVIKWSKDLLGLKIIGRSKLFNERVYDFAYGDMDNDGSSELIVLTGPPSKRENKGPVSIYHVRIHM